MGAKGTKHKHLLTDIDVDARTATCAACGPNTRISSAVRNQPGGWRCDTGKRGRPPQGPRDRTVTNFPNERVLRYTKEGQDLLAGSDGSCEICGVTPESIDSLYVDHCHATGKIRGLLCRRCNFGLGWFSDNVQSLEAAIRYLTPLQ